LGRGGCGGCANATLAMATINPVNVIVLHVMSHLVGDGFVPITAA
jgi:hypothetical protein